MIQKESSLLTQLARRAAKAGVPIVQMTGNRLSFNRDLLKNLATKGVLNKSMLHRPSNIKDFVRNALYKAKEGGYAIPVIQNPYSAGRPLIFGKAAKTTPEFDRWWNVFRPHKWDKTGQAYYTNALGTPYGMFSLPPFKHRLVTESVDMPAHILAHEMAHARSNINSLKMFPKRLSMLRQAPRNPKNLTALVQDEFDTTKVGMRKLPQLVNTNRQMRHDMFGDMRTALNTYKLGAIDKVLNGLAQPKYRQRYIDYVNDIYGSNMFTNV